jgi:hypothetical protein
MQKLDPLYVWEQAIEQHVDSPGPHCTDEGSVRLFQNVIWAICKEINARMKPVVPAVEKDMILSQVTESINRVCNEQNLPLNPVPLSHEHMDNLCWGARER